MTTAPFVELGFNPTDLRPRDLPRAGAFLGSPADAIEAALAVARAAMVDRMKVEVRGIVNPTYSQVLRIADLAWQAVFWKYRKVSAPVMADAYIRAYKRADAGDVPMSVIYDLADKHAEKVGDYFHTSSREALAEGFNGMVNRRVPAKAAADRVLDAYGLTPRQMRGYTAAKFETPITDVSPRALKAKAREYIDKSFTTRIRKLSEQEEHNIDQQAQQFAWMWLQDKDRLSERAEKLWITAKDERVCEVCGPLHGQKVLVSERFMSSHGEFWTPGLHPNCRCVVRLLENKFSVTKRFDPHQPRGNDGRWSGGQSKTRQLSTKVNLLQGPSAKVRENTVVHRGSQILGYLKEPRFITTPMKHRDLEMARVAHGAAAWSRRSANVTRTRDMADPDNEYYANKMKLTRTEKSLKSLIRAVESAPSNAPELYRGLSVSPYYLVELEVGSTMDLPLSSFSQDKKFSELFASKWGPMIARRRARKAGTEHHPDDAMPLVFVLESKAQALNISPLVAERQAEWIAKGEFLITKIGEDNGIAVVHLKQTRGKVSKDLGGTALAEFNEEHPRAARGRFGVKARTKTIDVDEEFNRIIRGQRAESKVDTATDMEFESIVAGQTEDQPVGFASPFVYAAPAAPVVAPAEPQTSVETESPFKVEVERTMLALAPPEARLQFVTDLVLDTRAALQTDPQVDPRTKPPTHKLDRPAYAVLTRANLHEGDISQVELNKGIEFSTSDIDTAIKAEDTVYNAIEKNKVRIWNENLQERLMRHRETGAMYHAAFSYTDIDDTLEWVARTATQHHEPGYDPDSIGDDTVDIIWYDEDNEPQFKEKVRYSQIAELTETDQGDFEVYMVRVDEAHLGEEHIEDISGSANSRERSFGMDGRFEWVPESVHRVAETQTYGVTAFKLTPSGIHETPAPDPTPEETVERLIELEGE